MVQTAIHADLEAELAAVAEGSGCELVHVEVQADTLRVFLDRPEGGVTLEDCAKVSREFSALLDLHDFGDRRYLLEVSSPGLDRKFYKPEDYERFRGRLVRVTTRAPESDRVSQSGAKKTIVGRLESYRPNGPGGGAIEVTEADSGWRHEIDLSEITVARLEIEL